MDRDAVYLGVLVALSVLLLLVPPGVTSFTDGFQQGVFFMCDVQIPTPEIIAHAMAPAHQVSEYICSKAL